MSPAIISRMALVNSTPGTRIISAPMVMKSTFWPSPTTRNPRASRPETVPPATVLKNRLVPSRERKVRHSTMAMPHSPPHRASRQVPPKKGTKAAAPTK